jgi:hypothetical protein
MSFAGIALQAISDFQGSVRFIQYIRQVMSDVRNNVISEQEGISKIKALYQVHAPHKGRGNLFKAVGNAISKIANAGISKTMPPQVKAIVEKEGNNEISELLVCRKPIISAVQTVLNFATLGEANKYLKEKGYDNFFHLWFLIRLSNGKSFKLEKNQRVNMVSSDDLGENNMKVPLNGKKITLSEFINRAEQRQGAYLWVYHPVDANCQRFVQGILASNGINSPELNKFVVQPVDSLIGDKLGSIGKTVTDIANTVDTALSGGGRKKRRKTQIGGGRKC